MSSTAPGNSSQQCEQAYPRCLRERERELLKRDARIGVALSGGGIRSATFAFGVMQAFAKLKTLKDIDVLSTVSGGGYTGSLISRLYAREETKSPDDVRRAILPERDTSKRESSGTDRQLSPGTVLDWLRDNGRYLAPNGDRLLLGTIFLRNWLSVHVVLATLVLTLFAFMQLFRTTLHKAFPQLYEPLAPPCVAGITSFSALESWLSCYLPFGDSYLWWSPWLLVPAFVLVLAVVPFSCAYWLESSRSGHHSFAVPILTTLSFSLAILLLLGDVPLPLVPATALFFAWFVTMCILGYVRNLRDLCNLQDLCNWLSHKLKTALFVFGFTLVIAIIDTLGQTVYVVWQASESYLGAWLATWSGGLVAAFTGSRWFVGRFAGRTRGVRVHLPVSISSAIAAVLLFAVTLTAVNALSHGIAWRFEVPHPVPRELLSRPAAERRGDSRQDSGGYRQPSVVSSDRYQSDGNGREELIARLRRPIVSMPRSSDTSVPGLCQARHPELDPHALGLCVPIATVMAFWIELALPQQLDPTASLHRTPHSRVPWCVQPSTGRPTRGPESPAAFRHGGAPGR